VTKSDNLNVILIYRPPSSGQDNLTELCEILRGADNNTILIGDFNMPGIDWENTQARDVRGRELLETATEKGLQQLVNFPTHTKGNTLDLLLTNCPDKILGVTDAGRIGRSDHCLLRVVMDLQPSESCRPVE
jgi:endonuclease/exonuclease/phosphatase family metal-dependent hydrolase